VNNIQHQNETNEVVFKNNQKNQQKNPKIVERLRVYSQGVRWIDRIKRIGLQPGPDYPMCTVCTCTLGPTTLRPHRQVNVKNVRLMFVIEVWLKCIEITTTKKVIRFYGEKMWRPHQNSAEIG